ncbi:MAG: S-layer homology domain-containing protein [Lutisporaceae bacterium]
MRAEKIKCIICIILSAALIMVNLVSADVPKLQPVKYTDIAGSKYESQLTEWIDNGFIKGFPDGTFKPENTITRAEFMALVNRSFGFTDTAEINYIDILKDKWYYLDAAKATKAGYMQGYDGKLFPLDPISRQAFATVLARLTGGEAAVDDTVINNLTDGKSIPEWSKAAISTTISKGYFNGLISDAFKPEEKITRLEAVVALDRAFKSMYRAVYSKSGTYGPASGMMALDGNVAIISPDVTLKNTTINGDLILRESIGDGNVCLENVVVKGTTIVRGGGENSIVIRNSSLGRVIVRREGNVVRIVATGSTTIGEAELQSGAILEEEFLTGEGFGDIVIPDDIFAGATIVFEGNFDNVTVDSGNININMANGAIGNLTLAQGAEGTTVNLAQQASVGTLNINAAVNITGQGSIQNANVNVSGSTIQQQPQNVVKAPGVTVNIDTPEPPPAPRTGGGGGSGRSSGDDDDDNKTAVVINAINNMFVTIGHKKNISINCTPADAKISSISGNPGVAKVDCRRKHTLEVDRGFCRSSNNHSYCGKIGILQHKQAVYGYCRYCGRNYS